MRTFTAVATAALLTLTAGALTGCAGNKECCGSCQSDKAPAATTTGEVKTINTMCPIGGDDFGEAKRPAELARAYKGENVGFCCEGCVKSWDKADEAKRDQILSLAKQNKAM